MKRELILDIAILLYVLLYSYAAASKLFNMNLFVGQLKRQAFPLALVPFLSIGIPVVELLVVLLMVIPKYRLLGLKLATGLMIVFTGYILMALVGVFKDMPCSCGGVISSLSWKNHMILNVGFLLLGVLALIGPARRRVMNLN